MVRTRLSLDEDNHQRLRPPAADQGRTVSDLLGRRSRARMGLGTSRSVSPRSKGLRGHGRPTRPRRDRRVREAGAPRTASAAAPGLVGVLCDSDVVIEDLRGRAKTVEAARALEAGGVPTYCTAIGWADIYAGIRPGEEPLTQAFFDARGEIVVDGPAGAHLARYARSHGVELADAVVAAAATTAGVRLWTLNRKHYPMWDIRFYEG